MLKHNLIITYRNFIKNKGSFLINLIGLSTGLACVLLIYMWINDEMNVDKFHENDSQLYQVLQNIDRSNGVITGDYTPVLLAETMSKEMPEIEMATSINNIYWFRGVRGTLTHGDVHLKEKGLFASEDFFKVFTYDFIHGNEAQVLEGRNSVVISENLALKIFGSTNDVIGKTLEWEHDVLKNIIQSRISGVFKNPPASASIQSDLIFNFEVGLDNRENAREWNTDAAYSYLVLKEGTNIDQFNKKIAGWLKSKDPSRENNTLFVQQYSERYLHGSYEDGVQVGGRVSYVKLFSLIGLFILLIACINFMNLSTGQASRRMKEIGVKKAMGLKRKAMVSQFLGESLLMAILALVVALVFVSFILPQFNDITGKTLEMGFGLKEILVITGLIIFTGLVAGSYPAFYLSGFDPVGVLKGKINSSSGEKWVRSGLVIFQFCLSIIFIAGVLVINQQMEYTQNKNLGYQRDNVISFHREDKANNDGSDIFLAEIKKLPGVVNASSVYGSFMEAPYGNNGYSWDGNEQDDTRVIPSPEVDYDFAKTMGMELLDGRTYSRDYSSEDTKTIINETAAKLLGYENPVGKSIKFWGEQRQIIGLVSDFHLGSLHHKVEPLFFRFNPGGKDVLVKIQAGEEMATIKRIQSFYERYIPGKVFEFTFLDEDYQRLYEAESRVAVLSKYFSILAIIISCLGLFGLAAFTTEQRKKEIGIRRALGQSSTEISLLLSGEFAKLVLIAILIGLPVSYMLMQNWLSSFAYRIELSLWYFTLAGLIALFVALLTVSSQSIKAAMMNPVEALRNE